MFALIVSGQGDLADVAFLVAALLSFVAALLSSTSVVTFLGCLAVCAVALGLLLL